MSAQASNADTRPTCEKHKIKMDRDHCKICDGLGEIECDDPLWAEFERCWQCAGNGYGFWKCELCEMEHENDDN